MEKERICCTCKKKQPTKTMIRIARRRTSDGFIYFIDEQGNSNGRGAYVCLDCVEKAVKTKTLNRSFKANIGIEIYEQLAQAASKPKGEN